MKKNELREYLLDNMETLLDIIDELNFFNGCLEHLCFFENGDEFLDTFFDSPSEAVKASWCGEYYINEKYVRFNAYGNIDSYDEDERDEKIKEDIDNIVDCLIEYSENIEIYDENLKKILEGEN